MLEGYSDISSVFSHELLVEALNYLLVVGQVLSRSYNSDSTFSFQHCVLHFEPKFHESYSKQVIRLQRSETFHLIEPTRD